LIRSSILIDSDMPYRLVCIFEKKGNDYKLRIEVCRDIGHMPPFLRNIQLDDVYRDINEGQRNLVYLVYHSGCNDLSPFIIDDPKFLYDESVQNELKKCQYIFLENSPHGSLKKGAFPIKKSVGHSLARGAIANKELYIRDINNWQNSIETRVRYEGTSGLIPTGSTVSCPIVQAEGTLVDANKQEIDAITKVFGSCYLPQESVLRLTDNPSNTLQNIMKAGWALYVPNRGGKPERVYSHTTSSGLIWFSTGKQTDDFITDKSLEIFLRSRNYVESDGRIVLLNSKDISSSKEKDLASMMGVAQDVQMLYSRADEVDIPTIKSCVLKKVKAVLRPYQFDGVVWLQRQRKVGAGCMLADEMGLGKTLQVLAHLSCVETTHPHLVVSPVSLVYNWRQEIIRFVPQLSQRIIVTSYDQVRLHLNEYVECEYDTIIIDEAQVIKNRRTQKYKALAQLHCAHKIILTGTPIENSIEDIWSHFIMLNPGMSGMYERIKQTGGVQDSEQKVVLSARLLNRFILRRTKDEVLKDLPEKSEKTVYVDLSDKEKTIYDNLYCAIVRSLETGLTGKVNSIVLEGLLRLRQVCVSANMLPPSLRFSQHIDSTKLNMALSYAERIKTDGHKVLFFSQFVSALQELEKLLACSGVGFVKLYGDTVDRKTPVESFQHESSITAFLLSLKAGGVGLNLTAADYVFFLDDWWNPAVEDQAMGRAHRIGQERKVFVYRLVCRNSVEEKILQLQDKKRSSADLFLNSSSSLSMKEIRDLLMKPHELDELVDCKSRIA